MKNSDDVIKFNTITDPGVISAFADVYSKMKTQNEMFLKLIEYLTDNRLITAKQAHDILLITLDQISDDMERAKVKEDITTEYVKRFRKDLTDGE